MNKKLLAALTGAAAVFSLSVVSAPSADALASCTTRNGKVTYGAFAGHYVNVGYRTCYGKPTLTSATVKAVYYSDSAPFGLGEVLTTTVQPWEYSHTDWRFTVDQTVAFQQFPLHQTWNFKVQFNKSGKARICFVGAGGACSSYQ